MGSGDDPLGMNKSTAAKRTLSRSVHQPACHGQSPGLASAPPTILVEGFNPQDPGVKNQFNILDFGSDAMASFITLTLNGQEGEGSSWPIGKRFWLFLDHKHIFYP